MAIEPFTMPCFAFFFSIRLIMSTSNSNYSHSLDLSWNRSFQNNTPLLFSLFLFFSYAVIFLIGLLANLFVIVMIIKRRRRRTLTNRFLLNLAISDLLATLICLPPTAYHYYDKRWIFGEFLCRSIPFMQGNGASCLNMLLKLDVLTQIRLAKYRGNRIRRDEHKQWKSISASLLAYNTLLEISETLHVRKLSPNTSHWLD